MQCQFGSSGRYVYIYKLGYGSIVLNEVIILKEAQFNKSTGGYDCEYNLMNMHTFRVLSCFVVIRCSVVTSLLMGSSDVCPRTTEPTVVNCALIQSTKKKQTTRFTWPTWGPPGSCRSKVGPMLAPWTLLSGKALVSSKPKRSKLKP